MPGGDGTGPGGLGPMTGRAAGYCAGYPVPGYMNPIPGGGGWGRGFRGGGRGRRNWFYATGMPGWARAAQGLPAWGGAVPNPYYGVAPAYPPAQGLPAWGAAVPNPYYGSAAPYPAAQATPQAELEALKGQAEYFEDVLDGINKRIEELEKQAKKT